MIAKAAEGLKLPSRSKARVRQREAIENSLLLDSPFVEAERPS